MAPQPKPLLRHLRRLVAAHDPASDAALLDRFVRLRDQDAFAELVRRYGPMVLGICRRVLRDQHRAEDALQAIFLVLAQKAATIRPAASLAAWLHTVARRLALNDRRDEECRRRHETDKVQTAVAPPPREPLDELTAREMLLVLDEELQRLPEVYRLPVILCAVEGQTAEEAARRLGWSVRLVHSRLARGRARLYARLTRRGLTMGTGLLPLAMLQRPEVALSSELAGVTVRSALRFAAERGALGAGVSCKAVALAEQVMKAMLMTKVKAVTVLLGVTLCLTGTGVLAYQALVGNTAEPPQAVGEPRDEAEASRQPGADQRPAIRVDRQGDPLPEGALARMGTVRWRHADMWAVALSSDGKTMASAGRDGQDGTVRLWEVATGKEIRILRGHKEWVKSVAFSPDGRTVVSGGKDNTVRLWEAATGKEIRILRGHKEAVESVAFSSDGRTVVSGGGWDNTVRLWEAATGKEIRILRGHKEGVKSVAFSSDGRTVVSGGWDNTVRLWEAATGREIRTLKGHNELVNSVSFSPNGKTVASGGRDGTVRLWEAATGKEIRILNGRQGWVESGPFGWVFSVAFSPDGKTVASAGGDRTVRLGEAATGKEIRTLPSGSIVRSVAFSSDGKTVAGAGGNTVHLWETATGREVQTLEGHQGGVDSVALSPDGKTMASAGWDRKVRLWEVATGKEIRILKGPKYGVTSVAFASDGKTVASGCWDNKDGGDNTVRLWDVATGKGIHTLKGHNKYVKSVAFSPDGKTVVSGGWDNTVRLWEVATGKEIRRLQGHGAFIESVAFSPDGKTVAAGEGQKNGTVSLWEAATGKEIRTLRGHIGRVHSVAFSSDGTIVAAGGYPEYVNGGDSTVHLWEVATGKEILILNGRRLGVIRSVALSPDGKTVASAADDSLHLWETATGKEIHTLRGHKGMVSSVAFSSDGRILASGSHDTTGLIWDVASLASLKPVRERSLPTPTRSQEPWEAAWTELADADPAQAYPVLWKLILSPAQALALLRTRLRPAAPLADPHRLQRWIADLDDNRFTVRDQAQREIIQLGGPALPALRQALKDRPSLEVRRRLLDLLAELDPTIREGVIVSPQLLRELRAVQVLESIGTAEAQRILQTLAKGASGARLTVEAQATLDRLAKRSAAKP